MNNIAEFIVYWGLTVGSFFFVLGICAFAADYVQTHRYERKWCWSLTNWLDSL